MTDSGLTLSAALAGAVQAAEKSVARVEGHRRLSSSGVVWSEDGLLLTAHHGLEIEDKIEVGLTGGKTGSASLVGRDPGTDVALLRLDASGLEPPAWAELGDVRVGQLTLAVSRPGRSARAALGIVSAFGESWRTPSGGRVERFLQSDVTPGRGYSGSLLIDASGKALGLNSAGLVRGSPVTIPFSTLRRVVEALLTHGRVRRGYLGVSGYPARLAPSVADDAGQRGGLILVSVQPDGPADRAGLLQGDLLLALGGKPILHVADLQTELDEDRIGQTLTARIVRAGRPLDVSVAVGSRP
jgi:serine protease DegQ